MCLTCLELLLYTHLTFTFHTYLAKTATKDVMPELKRAWTVCKQGKMEMLDLDIK